MGFLHLVVCSCVRVCPTWRRSGRCPWSATGGRRWRWWGGAASAFQSSAYPAPLTSALPALSFHLSSAQKVRDNNHHLSTVNVVTCPIGTGPCLRPVPKFLSKQSVQFIHFIPILQMWTFFLLHTVPVLTGCSLEKRIMSHFSGMS